MSAPTFVPSGASSLRRLARLTLPRREDYAELPRSWRTDLLAGLTVGIVALPLALGFGVASGVGATAGLVTAIVAGLVAAVFGGSHLQVSGPTGAMTVVLVPVVARYGPESVFALAILAGLFVVIMGLLGLGRVVQVIPWPVVEGFTLGIGIIIFLQQVPLALDVEKPDGDNAAYVAWRAATETDLAHAVAPLAVAAGVMVTTWVLARMRRSLPGSLVAIVAATVTVEVTGLDVGRIGALPAELPSPSVPAWDTSALSTMVPSALAIAALAALESLLSARVADGMADGVRPTEPDRELVGQGLANMASGLFGGMPATGAIARTAVNVRAGGRTRLAAASHAVVLISVVLVATPVVDLIPTSALAGVLFVTALRMIDLATARSIVRASRSEALVFLTTVGVTVVFDLILAVQVGVAVAAALALRAVARASGVRRTPVPEHPDDAEDLLHDHVALYRFHGALFFGGIKEFLDELAANIHVVVLDLGAVRVMDASGANALASLITDLRRRGATVLLAGLAPGQRHLATTIGVLDALGHAEHAYDDVEVAIAHARNHVRYEHGERWHMACAPEPARHA